MIIMYMVTDANKVLLIEIWSPKLGSSPKFLNDLNILLLLVYI